MYIKKISLLCICYSLTPQLIYLVDLYKEQSKYSCFIRNNTCKFISPTDILETAETAAHTVKFGDKRHYLLADIALVGESIMLAMRTHAKH